MPQPPRHMLPAATAQRSRIRAIIIPQANQADIADIPERSRRGIDFHPVRAMEEVVEIIL